MKIILCIICVFFLSGCAAKKTEFFQLDVVKTEDQPAPNWYHEIRYVVVSNPPREQSELEKITLRYARENVELPDVKNYIYAIHFYKETKYTPRNFIESSEKEGSMEYHSGDRIISIQFFHLKKMPDSPFWCYLHVDEKEPGQRKFNKFSDGMFKKRKVDSIQNKDP